jgi:high-affinity iron transporter
MPSLRSVLACGYHSSLARSAMMALLAAVLMSSQVRAQDRDVQTIWRLLDYIAVDYTGAVTDGQVVSQAEYDEMVEFSGQVETRLGSLPDKDAKAVLLSLSRRLRTTIEGKASAETVGTEARALATALLSAYPVPLAPATPPNLTRASALYGEHCASCHGARGDGRGPLAANLDPPPIAFTDIERARQRALFALYQVITLGLEGTSMASFDSLSDEDRWGLAFYVGSIGFPSSQAKLGESIWRSDPTVRQRISDMTALVGIAPDAAAAHSEQADALMAYLRRNPAVAAVGEGRLTLTRERLDASLKAYADGDRKAAADLALSAYLDGFEPLEPVLAARAPDLVAEIETGMIQLRSAIASAKSLTDVTASQQHIVELLNKADTALASQSASELSSFLGAFGILLREGLEALLVVVAMVAFLQKTDRRAALRYVHAGWITALAAGGATWFVATYLISISGASRELTEGFGSLFAALILVTVGIWMHGKSNAEVWQRYIREKMTTALSRRSGWFLFLLAFIVVYREVFETILFYTALWAQGNELALFGGAFCAMILLTIIAWIMLRYSARLPISTFFAVSSILVAVLAVVLAGKGATGLQEAGLINVTLVPGVPRVPILGIFPTQESLLAQLLATMLLCAGLWLNKRRRVSVK